MTDKTDWGGYDVRFDVAVIGGGLAGLCFARQIRRALPNLTVVVIEMLQRPLPEAAFKVGEATVEMGAHYLAETLDLAQYLEDRHLRKMGLRYFLGDASGPFADRPEMGLTEPPVFNSYLIDRGRLENDLRAMNEADGVALLEGVVVDDFELATGDGPHHIMFQSKDGGQGGDVWATWLIDATGRRRFLQRKLGLGDSVDSNCSAAWFRVAGRVDVEDLVPREDTQWHDRVPKGLRYKAVIHFLGRGYWVWIIALPSDTTSIGITTDERVHPLSAYSTRQRASAWLAAHEPALAEYLKAFPILDFRVMKRYSYTSREVFSANRWACVGEAAVFADPLYAPGVDMIGVGNNITVEMIRRDLEGRLSPQDVDRWSRWFIALNLALTENIQIGYPNFGHTAATSAKLVWDFAAAWGYEAPQMLNQTYLDPTTASALAEATEGFFLLQLRMQRMFADWSQRPPGRVSFRFLDYFTLRYLVDLRDRNLKPGKSPDEMIADAGVNMEIFEELAQALFLVAVEDQLGEYRQLFTGPVWLNAMALSMNPSQWEKDGLFSPTTNPRDITWIRDDLFAAFGLSTNSLA